MQYQKGFIIPLIITIVVVAILGTGGYFAYKQFSAPKQTATDQTANEEQATTPKTQTPPANEPADQTAGWKTYTNTQYGFEIKYPETNVANRIYPPEEIQINLPIAEEGMHTNIDAKILHVIVKPKDNNSTCARPNYYSKTNNVVINGTQFIFGAGGEGAAGHGYNYADYTIEKNNTCITMSFVISSYNDLQIPTYTGGKPFTQYDFSKEEPLINQIISTFKFTK